MVVKTDIGIITVAVLQLLDAVLKQFR
ncbi:hypothetical protein ACWYAI_11590 [Klebsiella quasipneumoniae]|nr:hypothetical protein [Klebsiella pneumoniae]HBU1045655.1 hypothetical protein [Klebsiella pneumoniae]